eukprot:TRINITY_DN60778_c0_g1_i1.p1 TRINITY_DN60778_c0_g1~~TRINITY_DN60778_c0_g1_i1.p1  ORF type:complete len:614 (+),score=-4.21 TRINITY_DN60778_c0_g1_i1:30-1871(+)
MYKSVFGQLKANNVIVSRLRYSTRSFSSVSKDYSVGNQTSSVLSKDDVNVNSNDHVAMVLSLPHGVKRVNAPIGSTLLDVAKLNDVNIDGTCAGDLNCSTCHCVLTNSAFNDSVAENPISTSEDDLLESAFSRTPTSRLSCQVKVTNKMKGGIVEFPQAMSKPIEHADVPTTPLFNEPIEIEPMKFKNITKSSINEIFSQFGGDPAIAQQSRVASEVFPFRVNPYVLTQIDWNNIPNDPIYQLNFPQRGMLTDDEYNIMDTALKAGDRKTVRAAVQKAANEIRDGLNPHPAGQRELNVPKAAGEAIPGIQHKYVETCLLFPSESQYCHAYCTYCFRWAQFVGNEGLQFASNDARTLSNYVASQPGLTDILFTGGDPMVMNSAQFSRYLDYVLQIDHISTIRIGTKSLAYWPYKYVTDDDADNMLKQFERIIAAGKSCSIMAHFSHPRELETPVVKEAIRRIRNTGAVIRCQAPIMKYINDSPEVWETMWKEQVKLGMVPYYMFMARDTGPRAYFEVPLVKAYNIFSHAVSRVPGVARTVRGPSMSATPGKVCVVGTPTINGEKTIALKFLQGRNPDWCKELFFAKYDEEAVWVEGHKSLVPAFGQDRFFFESP